MAGIFASRIGIGCSFGGTQQVPTRSLDFEASNSEYLSMLPSNFGSFNKKQFAISFWFKPETLSLSMILDMAKTPASNVLFIQEAGLGAVKFAALNGGTVTTLQTATGVISTGTWSHIYCIFDSTQSTADDRIQLYIDGVQPSFTSRTNPLLNAEINTPDDTNNITIGRLTDSSSQYIDGLLYQFCTFSGTLPSISDLYNSGSPKDVQDLTGLYSLLQTTSSSTLEDDEVLTTNWTNNNTVIKSTDVP